MTKGVASQSLSKTCPCGQTKVRLKPTGGAGLIVALPKPTKLHNKVVNPAGGGWPNKSF
jgi:hypothetical protein